MRYLFLSNGYHPAIKIGGPLHSVRSLAEMLVKKGHEVTVAAPDWDADCPLDIDTSKEHWVDGVRVHYIKTDEMFLKKLKLPAMKHTIRRVCTSAWPQWLAQHIDEFDIADIQVSFLPSAHALYEQFNRRGLPYLYHQRGVLDPIRLALKPLRKKYYIARYEKRLLDNAACLIALTQQECSFYKNFVSHDRIEVIPNGIDPRLGTKELTVSRKTQAFLGAVANRPMFFWMSRIHNIKGADIFVEAFIRTAKRNKEAIGVLAGPDEVGMEAQLKQRIKEEGLTDRFYFPGTLSGDDKLAYLRRADAFVFPTQTEGFSMVLLEALVSSCAILTSPGAYFDEIATAGAGSIVERNSESYADAMLALLKQPGKMKDQAAKAFKLVSENYTWDSVSDKYHELTAKLAKN